MIQKVYKDLPLINLLILIGIGLAFAADYTLPGRPLTSWRDNRLAEVTPSPTAVEALPTIIPTQENPISEDHSEVWHPNIFDTFFIPVLVSLGVVLLATGLMEHWTVMNFMRKK